MKKIFLLLALLVATPACAQQKAMTTTVETAFGSIAAAYAEKLAEQKFVQIDIVNDTDCDIQVQLDSLSAHTVVPAGTSETIDFGESHILTAVSLQYMSGETCSAGSVYLKGVHK